MTVTKTMVPTAAVLRIMTSSPFEISCIHDCPFEVPVVVEGSVWVVEGSDEAVGGSDILVVVEGCVEVVGGSVVVEKSLVGLMLVIVVVIFEEG